MCFTIKTLALQSIYKVCDRPLVIYRYSEVR